MKYEMERMDLVMSEFLSIFGHINLSTVIMVGSALFFMYNIYKKFTNSIIENHEKGKARDEKLEQLLEEVNRYPIYRQQSIEVQKELRGGIDKLTIAVEKIGKRQDEIEAERNQRKLNELRNKLMQMHQMYTVPDRNPMMAWTELEKESFNGIFKDYENLGGNGHMHSTVRPDMEKLRVIPLHETEEIIKLMQSRKI